MMRLSPALVILTIALSGCAEMGTILEPLGVPYSTYTESRCTSNDTFQCANRMSVGSPTRGYIGPSNGRYGRPLYYSFYAPSAGAYRVQVNPVPNRFATSLEVYDASYERIARGQLSGGRPGYIGLNVTSPGIYYVRYYSRSVSRHPEEPFLLSVLR